MTPLRFFLLSCLIAAPLAGHAADTDIADDGDARPPVAPAATPAQADAVPPSAPADAVPPSAPTAQADAMPPKPDGAAPATEGVYHVEHTPVEVRFDSARRLLTLRAIQQDTVAILTRSVVVEAQTPNPATLVIRTVTGQTLQFIFSPEDLPAGQIAALLAAIQAAPPVTPRTAPSPTIAREIASLRQERIDLLELKKRQFGTATEAITAQHIADLEVRLAELEGRNSRPGPITKPFTFETLRFTERSKQLPANAPVASGPAITGPTVTGSTVSGSIVPGPTAPTIAKTTTAATAKVTTSDIDRNFAKVRAKAFDVAAQQRLVNASRERPSNGLHRYERDQEQQAVLTHRYESFTTAVNAYNNLVRAYNRQVEQDVYQTVFTTEPENLSTMKAPPKN
jgi:hypothetical protein